MIAITNLIITKHGRLIAGVSSFMALAIWPSIKTLLNMASLNNGIVLKLIKLNQHVLLER